MTFIPSADDQNSIDLRWKEHPERLNHMKNMTASELSRRRLVPPKNPIAPVAPAVEAVGDGSAVVGGEADTKDVSESEAANKDDSLATGDKASSSGVRDVD